MHRRPGAAVIMTVVDAAVLALTGGVPPISHSSIRSSRAVNDRVFCTVL